MACRKGRGARWDDPARCQEGLGHFREIVCPRAENLETLFSTPDRFEGVAVLAEGRSDDIQEHGYWGSARDRLPASQTDALRGSGALTVVKRAGPRVTLHGHDGLTLIRSGQEWTETSGHERDLYLQQVEPVLAKGMRFLSSEGTTVGCHLNRYMQHVDARGRPLEKSFGLSYWRSLEHLERWSESHPTHIAIFGTFMNMVQEMNFDLKLRLYHEVTVAQAGDQIYEYVNCHPRTGMMGAIKD